MFHFYLECTENTFGPTLYLECTCPTPFVEELPINLDLIVLEFEVDYVVLFGGNVANV
jgi:hypothetical protein